MRHVGYVIFLLVFTLVAAEVLLRVINPLGLRVRGRQIVLPARVDHYWENTTLPGIDRHLHMHRNELGFRGPELPQDTTGTLRIIAVGGSTTECMYLSDGQDWTALLADTLARFFQPLWLNNAGLDGHSTHGHAFLLRDIVLPLHPQAVLLLVGANEVGRSDINAFDLYHVTAYRRWFEKSEILNNWIALEKLAKARKGGIGHYAILPRPGMETLELDSTVVQRTLALERPLVDRFGERLTGLIAQCRANGTEPILITQPTLFSSAMDPTTGVDLRDFPLGDSLNGALMSQRLELYNERTRAIGRGAGLLVIDLNRALPGNSTDFYDMYHFTKVGGRKVAHILAQALIPYLSSRFPQHLKH